MNIENLIRDGVDDLARDVPARPGLADDAIRRARRHQRVLRAAVTGGAALSLATATTLGLIDPAWLWSGSSTVAPSSPGTVAADVVLDLDDLSTGPLPETPWFADGRLHFGASATMFDVDFFALSLERVPGAYIVNVTPPAGDEGGDWEHRKLYLVPDGGRPTELARGAISPAVVSADGDRVAWSAGVGSWESEDAAQTLTSTVTVADTTTGEVLFQRPEVPSPSARPVGFLGDDRVLVEAAANTVWGLYQWDLGGDVSPWKDGVAAEDLARSADVGAFTAADGTDVVDITTGETLWTDDASAMTFSPNGRYVATVEAPIPDWVTPEDLEGAQPGDVLTWQGHEVTVTEDLLETAAEYRAGWDGLRHVVIADARNGEEVQRIVAETPEHVRWESDESVVFGAYQNTSRAAVVRCFAGDGCELATEPRDLDGDPYTLDNPYNLGDD